MKFENFKYSIPLFFSILFLIVFCIKNFSLPFNVESNSFDVSLFEKIGLQIDLNVNILRVFSLIFSVLCLVIVFEFCRYFFGFQSGIISSALFCVQGIFLLQAGTNFLCFLLTFLVISALYFYFKEKYIFTFILLIFSVLIDYSSLIFCLFLVLISFMKKINHSGEDIIKPVFLSFFPILIFIVINIIFSIDFDNFRFSDNYFNNFLKYLYFTFCSQWRIVLFLPILAAILTAIVCKKMYSQSLQIILSLFIYIIFSIILLSFFNYNETETLPMIAVLCIISSFCVCLFNTEYTFKYIITCVFIIIFGISAYNVFSGSTNAKNIIENQIDMFE